MTLYQMSFVYAEDAQRFLARIRTLRRVLRQTPEREEAERLRRRIMELEVLLRQSRELRDLTRRYYERSDKRAGRCTR